MKQVTQVRAGDGTTVVVEKDFNEPGTETFEARLDQIGPFNQDNPAASQAATAMPLANVASQTEAVMGRAGTIVGVVARSNAAITAGTATFRAMKNGAGAGDAAPVVLQLNVQGAVGMLATPVDFVAADRVGISLATNAGYLPITADHQAWLLIRWAPT